MAEQYSLSGRVFQKIKEDILSGKYADGDELREVSLGEELGVSRTPVREALRQLELEGLVLIVPNKGAYVKGITAKDVSDIYHIRARLEGLCAAMAAKSATKEQLDRLNETVLLSKFYEQRADYDHLVEMDSRFHEIMYEACASKMLQSLLTDYHQYVQRVRKSSLERTKRAQKATEEHEEILNAICAREEELADQLATRHILNAMQNIRDGHINEPENRTAEKEKSHE